MKKISMMKLLLLLLLVNFASAFSVPLMPEGPHLQPFTRLRPVPEHRIMNKIPQKSEKDNFSVKSGKTAQIKDWILGDDTYKDVEDKIPGKYPENEVNGGNTFFSMCSEGFIFDEKLNKCLEPFDEDEHYNNYNDLSDSIEDEYYYDYNYDDDYNDFSDNNHV